MPSGLGNLTPKALTASRRVVRRRRPRIDAGLQRLERQLVRVLGIERIQQRPSEIENGAASMIACAGRAALRAASSAERAEQNSPGRQARCLLHASIRAALIAPATAAKKIVRHGNEFRAPRDLMPRRAVGSCLPIRIVLEAPAYQRSFAWEERGKPASCSRISVLRSSRRRSGGTATTSWAPCYSSTRGTPADLAAALAASASGAAVRGRRRPAAPDHAHHSVLRTARSRGRTGPPDPRACWQPSSRPGRQRAPRLSLAGADEAFFQEHVRAGRQPACCRERRLLAGGAAHPGRARSFRDAGRLRARRAAAARRFPARPLLRRARRDHRHRSRASHVHGVERHGQAAGAQRHS